MPMWSESDGKLCRIYKEEEIFNKAEDMLQLKYSLQRRGMAMQVAHMLSFEAHEKLVDYYFEEMSREPPHRYDRVSLDQVMRMDREVFVRLGELTRDGFKTLGNIPAKEYPLDRLLEGVIIDPRVMHLMLPLPATNTGARSNDGRNNRKREPDNDTVNQLRNEIKRLKSSNSGSKGSGKGGNKGGSGGGKDGKAGKKPRGLNPSMPKELRGMVHEVNGKRLCFAYNMRAGCDTRGEHRCPKGDHLCCYPGCGGEHTLAGCPAYAKNLALKK